MEEKESNMDRAIQLLSRAPEHELDDSMCRLLAKLVGMDGEKQKQGVRYILDATVAGSLGSGFAVNVLDTIWFALGGKLEDVPAENRGEMPEFLK